VPRIVQYEQQTMTPDPGRAYPPRAQPVNVIQPVNYDDIANAVRGAHGAYEKSRDEEARAWSSDALANTRLKWTQELINRKENAEPGAPEFSPRFIKDYDEYANEILKTAPTERAKKFLQSRLLEIRNDLGERAMGFEAQARVDYRADKFTAAIDSTAKLMNTDPSQFKVALEEQFALIDGAALPPVQKSALRQKAVDKIAGAAVWAQVQKSPTAFLESIGFMNTTDPATGKVRQSSGDLKGVTGNEAFDTLPFERRMQMFEQAVRLKAQTDADIDRLAKIERARIGDEALKNLWALDADKKLTRNHIEAVRPLISSSEYKSALKMLESPEGGVKTDPGAFRQLQGLIAGGQFDEAVNFAFRAHRNGQLSNEHLASEVNRARSQGRQEGPKTEYERSRSYITQSMDPGPLVQDPVGRSRLAEALDTFDRWVIAEKRTDEQVEKRAKEIVQQHKFINLQDTLLGLPMPRSGNIRRNTSDIQGVLHDIAAAKREADRRYDAKQYSKTDYDQEISNLNRWRKAVQAGGK